MSVVRLDSENVIATIVESMLPRFSDHRLGLFVELDFDIFDCGYADDGNTLEREELTVRRNLCFLFQRPSNYTKVFFWEPQPLAVGLDTTPLWSKEIKIWTLECDHDSCWRSDGLRKITDVYFEMCKKFEGRIKSGKPLNICELSNFMSIRNLTYVYFNTLEKKNPNSERWTKEERIWKIQFETIDFSMLKKIKSLDPKKMSDSGILVEGSEDHLNYLKYYDHYFPKNFKVEDV